MPIRIVFFICLFQVWCPFVFPRIHPNLVDLILSLEVRRLDQRLSYGGPCHHVLGAVAVGW